MIRTPLSFPELPYYLTVEKLVDNEKDLVTVEVHSRIHVNKTVLLPTQYSIDYTNQKPLTFRQEILCKIMTRYDLYNTR